MFINKGISCVGFYFDLFGYGNLLASAGGNLNSEVGKIAFKRIQNLIECFRASQDQFPKNTIFFQFNDSILASYDTNIESPTMMTDSETMILHGIETKEFVLLIQFISACAILHQKICDSEELLNIGSGGRSVVCYGKRWQVENSDKIFDSLQANIAIAEAYQIDSLGSKGGFRSRVRTDFYINDILKYIIESGTHVLSKKNQDRLGRISEQSNKFPKNIFSNDGRAIEATIFYRKRKYYSLDSYMASYLFEIINNPDKNIEIGC